MMKMKLHRKDKLIGTAIVFMLSQLIRSLKFYVFIVLVFALQGACFADTMHDGD